MNRKPVYKQDNVLSATIPENALIRLLIDNLSNAVFVKDTTGRFVLCNQAFAKLYGVSIPETLIGKTDSDLRPAEQVLQLLAEEQQIMRTGHAIYHMEETWINPLTDEVTRVSINKIPFTHEGEVLGIIGIVSNSQPAPNATIKLHRLSPVNSSEPVTLMPQRTLLRTMIDLLPAMIYAKDVHSQFLECNMVIARSMGTTPQQLIGKTDFDFYPTHMAQTFFDDEQAIINSGQAMIDHEEQALDHATGVVHTLSTSKIPFFDACGNVIGIVGIGHDVTKVRDSERRQRDLQQQLLEEIKQRQRVEIDLRLAQKLESVGRLASGIAHEVNTPIQFVSDSLYFLRTAFDDLNTLLTAYRSVFDKMATGESPENLRESIVQAEVAADQQFLQTEVPRAFERIFNGTERVSSIVRSMREFAHPDVSEHTQADINHALQTTLVVTTNEYKYVATVHTLFAELPHIVCNIGELNQVFLNLIVNAAHAIQDAGKDISSGEIHIRTEIADEQITIRISDNGCGIPAQHLDKIYDPFFTTKEVGRGNGQGLAITRSIIVDKHGGQVNVNSIVGQGTEFVLQLPINGRVKTIV